MVTSRGLSTLPAQPGSLFGREREIERVCSLLADGATRLLTLMGAPGTGKTRLALAVSAELVGRFADGVRFVDLSSITDPLLVASSIARALGVREVAGRQLVNDLAARVRNLDIMLTLDNFEQVLPAASVVAELLAASSRLRVLVTSRTLLNLRWERAFEVRPLELPDIGRLQSPFALESSPAVALFVERARAIRPDFELTDANAQAVAAVCVRLEGLPLAIELAAARTNVFPAYAILDRLEPRLDTLASTAPDYPPRHHTLREAVGWSYDLLGIAERSAFRRLAVFVGSFTLHGAERICAEADRPDESLLPALSKLVDSSLLRPSPDSKDEPRFSMLETIRQYALERLESSGEAARIRRRHAEICLEFARQAEPELLGAGQAEWLLRLDRAHDNIRSSLRWCLGAGESEFALQITAPLWNFWASRGHLSEGERWLSEALSRPPGTPSPARARALSAAGNLARAGGDGPRAHALYRQSLAVWEELGDQLGIAAACNSLGNLAGDRRDYVEARNRYQQSLDRFNAAGELQGVATSLTNLGMVAGLEGDHAAALTFHEQSLSLQRQLGHERGVQSCLNNLANAAAAAGDLDRAAACHHARLIMVRERGDEWGVAITLNNLALIARDRGDLANAMALIQESTPIFRRIQDKWGIAISLYNLATITILQGMLIGAANACRDALVLFGQLQAAAHQAECLRLLARIADAAGHPEAAARLLGAAEGYAPVPEPEAQAVRARLDPGAFEAARQAGRTMPIDQAITIAVRAAEAPAEALPIRQTGSVGDPLSRREREVAFLVARGLTNRQIAERLFISERTVESHVASILSRLGLASRSQAAAWAVEHGLLTPTRS